MRLSLKREKQGYFPRIELKISFKSKHNNAQHATLGFAAKADLDRK